ncbi:hypothetical protein LCGC14_2115330 [marine sediment metagenome]|uniref:Uncharacterized protein n=1 Tax=marine sediment metagenome TaxID=412755 RepID=A0A0F9E5Y6_9ZZZZ
MMTNREMVLREALDYLVQRLEDMEKPVNDCILNSAIHGAPYTGPTWEKELKIAKQVLAWRPAPDRQNSDE